MPLAMLLSLGHSLMTVVEGCLSVCSCFGLHKSEPGILVYPVKMPWVWLEDSWLAEKTENSVVGYGQLTNFALSASREAGSRPTVVTENAKTRHDERYYTADGKPIGQLVIHPHTASDHNEESSDFEMDNVSEESLSTFNELPREPSADLDGFAELGEPILVVPESDEKKTTKMILQ